MRARLTKDFRFEAAHTLPSLPEGHKCRQMHGHSFKVEISIEGEVDESIGWVYDHKRISEAMKPLVELMDHGYLNDIEGLESPTIERMAAWFWRKLAPQLPGLVEIVIYETPTARCSFKGEFLSLAGKRLARGNKRACDRCRPQADAQTVRVAHGPTMKKMGCPRPSQITGTMRCRIWLHCYSETSLAQMNRGGGFYLCHAASQALRARGR